MPFTRPDAPSARNLLWLDLEMTGLDAQNDVILQAAAIITDAELATLDESVFDVWQPDAALSRMTPFVRDMHEKNKLLERVRKSRHDLAFVERQLLERVAAFCAFPATLCGNSVGQDKRFVERHMPGLAAYLDYRIVDVSSLKQLARLWYGEPAVFVKPEAGAHDALVDIRNSIAELRHYRETLFRPA